MIYVIKTIGVEPGYFKVGFTKNDSAIQRLYKIQTGCPYRLEIATTMDGSETDEKELHLKMKDHRCFGEWFKDNPVTREVLKINASVIRKTRREGCVNFKGFAKLLIEQKFEHIQGVNNPRPVPLRDFCEETKLSEETVRRNCSRCFIVTTTAKELVSKIRFVNCHPSDFETEQPFIVPYHMAAKNGFSINTWDKIRPDFKTERDIKQLLCLLALEKSESLQAMDWT